MTLYDINLRKEYETIRVLADDVLPAGKKLFYWDGSQNPSGVYIVHSQAGRKMQTEKVILLK